MKCTTRSPHAAQRNAGKMLSPGADSRIALRFIRATYLEALTTHNEASLSKPWAVADAPHEFTEKLIGNIVGFESKPAAIE